MSSSFAAIPKTAPFADEDIELLNRVVGPASQACSARGWRGSWRASGRSPELRGRRRRLRRQNR